ncbi:Toprim domain-containing protein [Methylomagnum ishizawai]|uniref:Toprim domain-containing protein n=1 Tax=Methylomagnum ishizawai TaxID=1760988 RepID=A0A1Y6D293_9GAMM|nr:DUF3987 domain-containing protein [Methylomagnum ishizawai]SMF97069.1 Toprim domain-containing protein [Methylomagnum ishizawai]
MSVNQGDAITFVREYERVDFEEACRILGATDFDRVPDGKAPPPKPKGKTAPPESPEWVAVVPVPDDAPPIPERHPTLGVPSHKWWYTTPDGKLSHVKCRFPVGKSKDGKPPKTYRPLAYFRHRDTGVCKWEWEGVPAPRPLYGLHKLAKRPKDWFLWCEGEKAADAAQMIFPEYVCIASENGADGVDSTDWEPLRGRRGIIWPDNDAAGEKAARRARELLAVVGAEAVAMRRPSSKEMGWDAADALAEGIPAEDLRRLCGPGVGFEDLPLDVFGSFELPRLRAHHVAAPLVSYVFDQAAVKGVEPLFVYLGALTCCAGVLHDQFQVQPARYDPTWKESPRLWTLLVGDPSTGKTPAINAVSAHVQAIDIVLAKQSKAAIADWELDKKVAEKQMKRWVEDAAKRGAGDKGDKPRTPEKPPDRRCFIEDTTVEALAEILAENPAGVFLKADEFAGWLGAMDAYSGGAKGKDRAHWLQAYNGGPRRVDRVNRGSTLVPNFSVSILGGVQPDKMRNLKVDLTDDGLLQRFLVVVGAPAAPPESDTRPPNLDAIHAYRELLDHLQSMTPPESVFKFSPEAASIKAEFLGYVQGLVAARVPSPAVCAYLGKWPGMFARLALLCHVVEYAGQVPRRFPPEIIGADTVRLVVGLMREILLPHGLNFYLDIMGAASGSEHSQWIAGFILSRELQALTIRDITRAYKSWRSLTHWEQVGAL